MIYLYLKEIPGLKYLGVTSKKDPHSYRGSGKYWRNHLKSHKIKTKDINTTILLETEDKQIISFWGIYYSKIWNIVESEEFANLMPESGDQNTLGRKLSQKEIDRIKLLHKGNSYHLGQPHTEESKKKMSDSLMGREGVWKDKKFSEEHKLKLSKAKLGKITHNAIIILNTETGIYYDSISKAAKSAGISHPHLSNILNNKYKNVKTPFIKV